jgi:UDP-glucose:(heptosyl)LPS alpha-1,3-glucosyltransferase
LIKFMWWFVVNHLVRWRDSSNPDLLPDVIYSPGINCMDADAIVVHIVFNEFYKCVCPELRLSRLPLTAWPRTLHRKLYYRLIMFLENRIYRNPQIRLVAVSQLLANKLQVHFQRTDVAVIPNAVDIGKFLPAARIARRSEARQSFGFAETDFVLLLIGNDWKNKGLDQILQTMVLLREIPFRLLVVGSDNPRLYRNFLNESGLRERVRFQAIQPDVLAFYAAADAYVSPSREDSFGLPIVESMACGLPVIASARAGASEVIEHGKNGLILRTPENPEELATILRSLYEDTFLQRELGENAAKAAKELSWEANVMKTLKFLEEVARMKSRC